jgi:L-alanine-DL-glutamate epimerase-like enolase superfamily enzyme
VSKVRVAVETRTLAVTGAGNANTTWTSRSSARLSLELEGTRVESEASPLEGYAPDTFAEALTTLERATPASALDAATDLAALEALSGIASPSARFALECAVLDMRAQRRGSSLVAALGDVHAALLGPGNEPAKAPARPLRSVALLAPERDLDEQLEEARELGAGGAKIKIGRDLSRDLDFARAVRAALRPGEALRIDANGTLPSDADLDPFVELDPEFVEEPVHPIGPSRRLALPIALDETLFRDPETARSWLGTARALVLKPMTLGLLTTLQWAALGQRHGTWIVVSHCFDGALAARAYSALAQTIGTPGIAMGLGAHPGLRLWEPDPA